MRLAVTMLAGVLLLAPAPTRAQADGAQDDGAQDDGAQDDGALDDRTGQAAAPEADLTHALALERTAQRGERYAEGTWLLSYAIGSMVVGGAIAGAGHEDPFWLWAGLGSAAWGLINVWFALPMMDLGGGQARAIDEQRSLRGDELRVRREDLASDQYGAASVFAFNGGLDVFYVATGIFLAILGAELLDTPSMELAGYGVAMAAQGVGLLAFDVAGWIRAEARGDRLQRLGR